MIAPMRPPSPETTERQQRLRRARHVVAQSLLPRPASPAGAPQVAKWKAVALLTWMAVAAGCYVARLLNLWD